MNCLECGACCRYFELPVARLPNDTKKWISYHEGVEVFDRGDTSIVRIWAKCRHLNQDNTCAIYCNRPLVCRLFQKGGKGCQESRSLLKIDAERV